MSKTTLSQGTWFKEVLEEEMAEIDLMRKIRLGEQEDPPSDDDTSDKIYGKAWQKRLMGLSFSGGGIRSATFNLGVLQGLAERGLLPMFHYLSTVSGGGYIGSWLAAWIKRCGEKEVLDGLMGQFNEQGCFVQGAWQRRRGID